MTESAIEFSEMEFALLRDFIHDRFGILFPEGKKAYIQMKLYPRLAALRMRSYSEYLGHLKYGGNGVDESSRMMSLITNNETYFWRETPQLEMLRERLLPEIRERKVAVGSRQLRILSAGCSTGEEAYTLAMLVFETGSFFWEWDARILGLDVSERAIGVARGAHYQPRSLRMTDKRYIERYFVRDPNGFVVKPSLRRFVEFRRGNLLDPDVWNRMEPMDALFCRNVMIYFSRAKIEAALDFFHQILAPGGYLFLGHSETYPLLDKRFEPLRMPGCIVYRKREAAL